MALFISCPERPCCVSRSLTQVLSNDNSPKLPYLSFPRKTKMCNISNIKSQIAQKFSIPWRSRGAIN